jgi:hypothetical protein
MPYPKANLKSTHDINVSTTIVLLFHTNRQFSNGFIVKTWYEIFSPTSAPRVRYLVTSCNRSSLFAYTTRIAVAKRDIAQLVIRKIAWSGTGYENKIFACMSMIGWGCNSNRSKIWVNKTWKETRIYSEIWKVQTEVAINADNNLRVRRVTIIDI